MKRPSISELFLLGSMLLLSFCASKEEPPQKKESAARVVTRITALPTTVKSTPDNPLTEKKIELGRLLFFDPILSGDRDIACATCHHPDNGYAEFLDISIGVNGVGRNTKRVFREPNQIPFVKRNANTILNTAYNGISIYDKYDPANAPMFWDDRVRSLEKQALEPIKAFEEMRGLHYGSHEILEEVTERLAAIPEYRSLFAEAFGSSSRIDSITIAKAIAAFERTLVTNNSRFDLYMRGDKTAISLSEQEGFELFKSVGCANCHNGPMLSDFKLHVLGIPDNPKLAEVDRGVLDSFAFRTPTLRNLRFTAPYMHNGSLQSLQQVLEFYEDISTGKMRSPHLEAHQLDPLVGELDLSVKDMSQIISFLNTLNDSEFDRTIPPSVPSGLPVAGNILE